MVHVVVGVALASCGTFSAAWGSVLVPTHPVAGNLLVGVVGTAFQLIAMQFAPFYVIAPLAGTVVPWTRLIQRRPDVVSTSLIVIGCALVGGTAALAESRNVGATIPLVPSDLMIVCVIGAVAIVVWYSVPSKLKSEYAECTFPGAVGGLTNLTLKVATSIASPLDSDLAFVLPMCAAFAVVQFYSYNHALRRYPASNVNSIYIPSLIVDTSAWSGVVLHEFSRMTTIEFATCVFGLALASIAAHLAESDDAAEPEPESATVSETKIVETKSENPESIAIV